MNEQYQDVAATPPGHSGSAPSPVPGLGHAASVPNAGDFGVVDNYGFDVLTITKVTEQCFWYTDKWHKREKRTYRSKLVCWAPDRATAELAAARLTSARAELNRRESAARLWFNHERAKIAAQAIEARSAATGTGAVEDESAVAESDAP